MFLIILTVALLHLTISNSIRECIRALKYRNTPKFEIGRSFFNEGGFAKLLARMVIFAPSWKKFNPNHERYRLTLRNRVYREYPLKDTVFNRRLLEWDLNTITDEKRRLARLTHYPLTPSRVLLEELMQLYKDGNYQTAPVILRHPLGGLLLQQWADHSVDRKLDLNSLEDFLEVLRFSSYPPEEVLMASPWRDRSEEERERILTALPENLVGRQLGKGFCDWFFATLENEDLQPSCGTLALLGQLYNRKVVRTRAQKQIWAIFEARQRIDAIDDLGDGFWIACLVEGLNYDERLTLLSDFFQLFATHSEETALEFFHELVHADVYTAEIVARSWVSGADTSLRKGIIVYLVRHGSSLGERYLDGAFIGTAPRTVMFGNTHEYAYGSRATEEYIEIAGHDYLETGKSYPPNTTYTDKNISEKERRWRAFINDYPWHPGTDDAYYHLIYILVKQGRQKEAQALIRQFEKQTLADRDASPFVERLKISLKRAKPSN